MLTYFWNSSSIFGVLQLVIIPFGVIVFLHQTADYRFSVQYGAVSAIKEIRKLLRIKMDDAVLKDACDDLIRNNVVELLHRENKYGKDTSSAKRQRAKALTMYRVLHELKAVKKPFNDFFALGD